MPAVRGDFKKAKKYIIDGNRKDVVLASHKSSKGAIEITEHFDMDRPKDIRLYHAWFDRLKKENFPFVVCEEKMNKWQFWGVNLSVHPDPNNGKITDSDKKEMMGERFQNTVYSW